MKRFLVVSLSSFFPLLLMVNEAFGQAPPPAKMTSTTRPSSTIQSMTHREPIQPQTTPQQQQVLPTHVAPPVFMPQQAEYLHPGILVNLGGRWEGSDHLLNLTNNIGVYISIVKTENEVLDITETQLKKEVEDIFTQANVKPQTFVTQGKPPLPAFEIEVFVYPIERGYVACCNGRLFESVVLDRFKMDSNMAFQAITWEKQHLIVSPTAQIGEQLTKTTREIASVFVDRFVAYERIKKSL